MSVSKRHAASVIRSPDEIVRGAEVLQSTILSRPMPVRDDVAAFLQILLNLEQAMRQVESVDELACLCVNEIGKAIPTRQIFYAEADGGKARLRFVTGTVQLDPNSPTIRWIEDTVNKELNGAFVSARLLQIAPQSNNGDPIQHPFPFGLWCPLVLREDTAIGGLLALRETEWRQDDVAVAKRLTETAAHAATTLRSSPRRRHIPRGRLYVGVAALALTIVALCWSVPMSVLAPMEISASNPFVIAAPIDGIVETLTVAQNSHVNEGDVLVHYNDTLQRNALQVSQREVEVADAKLQQALQGSFDDARFRRDIGQARAELSTKIAERDSARETFEKTTIRAPRAGIAVFDDPKDWLGKPVNVGTRIMEIVDPENVEARIDLAVADGLVASKGAHARLFLDSIPAHPMDARIVTASYHARMIETGALSYRLIAKLAPGVEPPHLGSRGTAQIFAENEPLAYYLFRRPLSWLRQKSGF